VRHVTFCGLSSQKAAKPPADHEYHKNTPHSAEPPEKFSAFIQAAGIVPGFNPPMGLWSASVLYA